MAEPKRFSWDGGRVYTSATQGRVPCAIFAVTRAWLLADECTSCRTVPVLATLETQEDTAAQLPRLGAVGGGHGVTAVTSFTRQLTPCDPGHQDHCLQQVRGTRDQAGS
jgi:hypothetical protein